MIMFVDKYKVKVVVKGFLYAVPKLYVKKKYPLIPLSRWVFVWEGTPLESKSVSQMFPTDTLRWFDATISAYELHSERWERFNNAKVK